MAAISKQAADARTKRHEQANDDDWQLLTDTVDDDEIAKDLRDLTTRQFLRKHTRNNIPGEYVEAPNVYDIPRLNPDTFEYILKHPLVITGRFRPLSGKPDDYERLYGLDEDAAVDALLESVHATTDESRQEALHRVADAVGRMAATRATTAAISTDS